jgi:hypothetical protein
VTPWRGGLLVAWVQGNFGSGGDTLRCQYYNAASVPQWAAPTVVATRDPTVIYIDVTGLNVIPTSTGATITYAQDIIFSGGTAFSYNQLNMAGQQLLANNSVRIYLPFSNYFNTLSDGGDGLYVVGTSGGLGTPLYAQHYDAAGAGWATGLNLTASGAGGRGSNWRLVRDPANNLYVVWDSDVSDVFAEKITPAGAFGWAAPGYVNLCSNPSGQTLPDALWHNNALWVIWNDDRTPASGQSAYMQKLDAAGTLAWPATGVLINNLFAFYTDPKLAPSDNGAVMAFLPPISTPAPASGPRKSGPMPRWCSRPTAWRCTQ